MPDWKNPKHYSVALSRARWAWEFMRRNAEYRNDFMQVAQAWKQVPRSGRNYRGPEAVDVDQLARDLGLKWKQLGPIADPANDATPLFFVAGPIEPDGEQVQAFYETIDMSDRSEQLREFATLTFDLSRPLPEQLRRAAILLRKRKATVPSIKPARSSVAQWRFYLRVLDAKQAGAGTDEIIAAISAYKALGTTAESKYAAQDRVSDHLKRARQLLKNPLSLLL
jgi:hypothetical protein